MEEKDAAQPAKCPDWLDKTLAIRLYQSGFMDKEALLEVLNVDAIIVSQHTT